MGPTGTGKEAMGAIDNKIPMEWYSQDMFKSMNSLCANFDYKKKNVKTKNTRLYGQNTSPSIFFVWPCLWDHWRSHSTELRFHSTDVFGAKPSIL